MTGLVFNIQKYVLHDGPGIRTTVFFKGCPLACTWCHNPESIKPEIEKMFNEEKCIGCNECDEFINPEPCPTEALEYVGEVYTHEELFREIEKDFMFYDKSGGGVTFSGGEPLLQSRFLLEVLKLCKERGIHTAVDTTGFSNWDNIKPILPYVDLFLYDLKILNSDKHKKYTGVENELIIENFKKISKTNDTYIRVPLIKSINDDDENIKGICRLAKEYNAVQINFLPYHNYSENKYRNLVSYTEFINFEKPSKERMDQMIEICNSFEVQAYIGG